jgi:hypothetical protein
MNAGRSTDRGAAAALQRALEISEELTATAASGEAAAAAALDAERRRLLESARKGLPDFGDHERQLLAQIAALNDRSIGLMEHRLRAKARDLDMAAVGAKAVRAYSATRRVG